MMTWRRGVDTDGILVGVSSGGGEELVDETGIIHWTTPAV
jgi:hypothetical protein